MSKRARLKYVDFLKVLAMIPVVVCHWTRGLEYANVGYVSKILPDRIFSIYLGAAGVSVFFVLSGISLMYVYEGRLDIKKYYFKRFVGIYPMFWLTWIIAFMYVFVVNRGVYPSPAPVWTFIWTILGTDSYFNLLGPNWYLVGEWFLGCLIVLYILFPLLKWGVEKHPLITGIILVSVSLLLSFFYYIPIFKDEFFGFRILEFAFGMYFVKYWKKPNWIAGLISLIVLILLQVLPLEQLMGEQLFAYSEVYRIILVGIAVVIFGCWLCSCVKWDGFFRLCASVAKYCYPVFLTHHIIITEYTKIFSGTEFGVFGNIIAFMIVVVIIAVASVLLYRLDKWIKGLFRKQSL